jgi:hypothetical protein
MIDPETMGAPASPYEACLDALREWEGKADPAYLRTLRVALFDGEMHRIRTHYAPMAQRVMEAALQYDREGRN